MSYVDTDPKKPTPELLADIRSATQQPGFPGLPLLPFANLVVKVGEETRATIESLKNHISDLNEKNAKLQWWVVALAIAALVSTVVQTVVALAAFFVPNQPFSATAASTATTKAPTVSALNAAASAPGQSTRETVNPKAAPK